MPIIETVGKMQVRRGLESELPGTPINTNPPQFGSGLDVGEYAMSTDTSRVFIGHDPKTGQPNYQRLEFPYQNVEVLTEVSPRVRELVNQFLRNTDETSYLPAVPIAASATGAANLTYYPAPGGAPTVLEYSTTNTQGYVEYMAYYLDQYSNGTPFRQGTLRIIGASTPICDDDYATTESGSYGALQFSMGAATIDSGTGANVFPVNVSNNTGLAIGLFLRFCRAAKVA